MSTRFYLPSTGAAEVNPTYSAGWEYSAGADRLALVKDRISSSFANKIISRTGTTNDDCLFRQYVSPVLSTGTVFATTDTIKGMIRVRCTQTSYQYQPQMVVKVVSENGGTLRATLIDFKVPTTAWPNSTMRSRKYPSGWTGSGQALAANYTTVSGDRLVIEVGYRQPVGLAYPYAGYMSFGDTSDSDLGETEDETQQYNPWFEFSNIINFPGTWGAVDFTGSVTLLASPMDTPVTPTELGSHEFITCLAFGDHLLMQIGASNGADLGTSPGDVIVSLDGDTFVKDSGGTNCDIIWSLPYGNFLGPAAAPWGGEMIPYFFTETELYALDFWGRKAYPLPTGLQTIKCACLWSDSLVLSDGYNITQVMPGEPVIVRPLGLHKEQGFLATGNYRVEVLKGVAGGDLYAILSNGTNTWIWQYTGAAWHPLGKPTGYKYGIGLIVTDTSLGSATNDQPRRAYWKASSDLATYPSELTTLHRILDPTGDPNPLVGTGTFEIGDFPIDLPWLDGGFRDLDGAALQMYIASEVPTNTSVSVYYRLDGSTGSFTFLGMFDGSNLHLNFGSPDTAGAYPGIQFRTIQLRFVLSSSSSSATPNALAMAFVFRKKPSLRMAYVFTIDASEELDENIKTFPTIMNELKTAWNSKTLVRFYYPVRNEDDTTVADGSREVDARVDIVGMPTQEQEIQQSMRMGLIRVQVMEPVSW